MKWNDRAKELEMKHWLCTKNIDKIRRQKKENMKEWKLIWCCDNVKTTIKSRLVIKEECSWTYEWSKGWKKERIREKRGNVNVY